MRFYEELFLSENMKDSKEEVIKKITSGETLYHTYLIVMPRIPTANQLESMHCEMFKELYSNSIDYIIVGVAQGYQGALELIEFIAKMVYNETGTADIRSYFRDRI
ncbi:MAG: hypothetical protein R3Y40_00905 [Eubacteriales bacterium]